jgi:hypothetical protein
MGKMDCQENMPLTLYSRTLPQARNCPKSPADAHALMHLSLLSWWAGERVCGERVCVCVGGGGAEGGGILSETHQVP